MRAVPVLVISMLLPIAVGAQRSAPTAAAERNLAQARQLMERGQYAQAASACKRAYRLKSDPTYVLWLARVYARANQMTRARATLARYKRLRRAADKRVAAGWRGAGTDRSKRVAARGKQPKPRLSDIVLPHELPSARQRLRALANSRSERGPRPAL